MKNTWGNWLEKLKEEGGGFILNAKSASFSDMVIISKEGTFVVHLQEKQAESSKEKNLNAKKVPDVSLADVKNEHEKCNIGVGHLFVMITDKAKPSQTYKMASATMNN
mmetsp:Transcript_21456/g.50931  ORF Transcript_21456/g.50931 Transcript_21456/m.50931 type:complete len:108 (+) Transcript_21456:153-476(+)